MELDETIKPTLLAVSRNWLALVDAGDFVEAWKHASQNFRTRRTIQQLEAGAIAWNHAKSSHHSFTREFKAIRTPDSLPIRYAWPAELDLMARLAGMRLRQRWSNW